MSEESQPRYVCVLVWVSHLSGHRWTRLCSFASAAGSTCAERRCTAMLGRLARAGQTGTYMCTNKQTNKLNKCEKVTFKEPTPIPGKVQNSKKQQFSNKSSKKSTLSVFVKCCSTTSVQNSFMLILQVSDTLLEGRAPVSQKIFPHLL